MKIAIMGTRGVPASYSGLETCVEQLGSRLVERGHEVTVYCRSHHVKYPEKSYKGMRLIKKGTIPSKYLDTLVHTFISSVHALSCSYDIALYFIAGNGPVTWMPRLVGTKTVLHVDGLDWKREKWPSLAKQYIKLAEYLATILPNVYLTDSRVVQHYYEKRFNSTPLYVSYGSEVELLPSGETLARFRLEPRKYFLFVGRLVPENCVHHLINAYRSISTDYQCVIVGDAPYAEEYKRHLRKLAGDDPRITFTGYLFGKGYRELGSNALAFIETSSAGGTHPAILEAMAFGNCVVVNNTEENLETIADAGLHYNGKEPDTLRDILKRLIADPQLVEDYRHRAKERAATRYCWESIVDSYETLFFNLLKVSLPERLTSMRPSVT